MQHFANHLPGTLDRPFAEIPLTTITHEEYMALGGMPVRVAARVTPHERKQDKILWSRSRLPGNTLSPDDLEPSTDYFLPEDDR